jgi:hypothetical protein
VQLSIGREVVEKQDGIEELDEIFDANSRQFLEDFTSNEVIARGFFWVQMVDDSLGISVSKAVDWRFKLIMGFLRFEGWVLRLQGGG